MNSKYSSDVIIQTLHAHTMPNDMSRRVPNDIVIFIRYKNTILMHTFP